MKQTLRCILCGGDHEPSAARCDELGMDREIARLGARRWNRLSVQSVRKSFKAALASLTAERGLQ
jgi:hypothetical protein